MQWPGRSGRITPIAQLGTARPRDVDFQGRLFPANAPEDQLIRQRVADFLKFHRPFEFFSEADRLALASAGRQAIAPPFAISSDKNTGKLYVAR